VPAAAILIGGRARRLGGVTKPLLRVGDRTILQRQLDALGDAGIEDIVLVGRWAVEERRPAPIVADAVDDGGALGALYTALLVAPATRTIVLAGDMPFVAVPLLRALMALDGDADAIVTRSGDGLHPLCGCYRRSIAARVKTRLDRGDLTVRAALGDLHVREVGPAALSTIDPDGTMLMNVNTLADYERACQAARHCH
jgi:molybdopterin-guanine dinucleotide biosynthesis protein A